MDLIKHTYHLGVAGFGFGEAHGRWNVCVFGHRGPAGAHCLAFLFTQWIDNVEMILYFYC